MRAARLGTARLGQARRGLVRRGKGINDSNFKEIIMKTAEVMITGTTPLLMHADNIDWADKMELWKNDPKNKKKSKAGDDRTPPWRWIGCLNHDENILTIPSEYIMRCMMEAAAQVPTGKGQKTFKSQSQSGLLCQEFHWPLLVAGKTVSIDDVKALMDDELTFYDHIEQIKTMGFELFTKRARIGQAKHIRVRPRFNSWSTLGSITIIDDQITKSILGQFMDIGGQYKGLGDWRPGAKTPGPFGMFTAVVK